MTLFPKTNTLTIMAGAFNSSGVWVSTPSSSTFVGSVQPLTGKEISSLTVGRVDLGKVKIYSNTKLNVSIKGGSNSGDVVIWQGRKWEIISAEEHQNDLIPHYKYIAEYRGEA